MHLFVNGNQRCSRKKASNTCIHAPQRNQCNDLTKSCTKYVYVFVKGNQNVLRCSRKRHPIRVCMSQMYANVIILTKIRVEYVYICNCRRTAERRCSRKKLRICVSVFTRDAYVVIPCTYSCKPCKYTFEP